jgi:glucose/arabinose dehydrogenase
MTLLQKLAAFTLAVVAISPMSPALAQQSSAGPLQVDIIARGLDHPWSLAFLPGGDMLVTERAGNLLLVADGKISPPISGLQKLFVSRQGGLLDVAVDPDFSTNKLIYLTYAKLVGHGAVTAVARAELHRENNTAQLRNRRTIFEMNKPTRSDVHFGSRLAIAPDGTLFFTIGDRGERARAQDPFDHAGAVLRIDRDGGVPADNPFADGVAGAPEIWSTGHRNPQGATINPDTGAIWTVEHGARGGDEINLPQPGRNYGWPVISYGRHYSGQKIGVGTTQDGLEQPEYYWDPSIAPSGLDFYDGTLFSAWRGDLLVGALKDQMLVRLDMANGKVVGEERLLQQQWGRIRDVRTGPDGAIWLLTDEDDGQLLRVTPAP